MTWLSEFRPAGPRALLSGARRVVSSRVTPPSSSPVGGRGGAAGAGGLTAESLQRALEAMGAGGAQAGAVPATPASATSGAALPSSSFVTPA